MNILNINADNIVIYKLQSRKCPLLEKREEEKHSSVLIINKTKADTSKILLNILHTKIKS